jgi:hypothetical protein
MERPDFFARFLGRLEAGERLQHPEVTAIIATHTSKQEKTEDRTVAGPEPQAESNAEQFPEAVTLSVSPAPELKSEPAPQVLEQISQGAQQEEVVTRRRPVQDLKAELAEALRERDAARNQAKQLQRELANVFQFRLQCGGYGALCFAPTCARPKPFQQEIDRLS